MKGWDVIPADIYMDFSDWSGADWKNLHFNIPACLFLFLERQRSAFSGCSRQAEVGCGSV